MKTIYTLILISLIVTQNLCANTIDTAIIYQDTPRLTWEAAKDDKSILGYRVKIGWTTGQYERVVDVGNKTSVPINRLSLPYSTPSYISVVSYNRLQESDLSNEVVFTRKKPRPQKGRIQMSIKPRVPKRILQEFALNGKNVYIADNPNNCAIVRFSRAKRNIPKKPFSMQDSIEKYDK